MKIKSAIVKPFASRIAAKVKHDSMNAVGDQLKIFQRIIKKAQHTIFGQDHGFGEINETKKWANHVPIRDYEQLKIYIDRVVYGEANILWPGRPKYFAKTSGTTSGSKYIPISKDSMPNHFNSARNALFCQANRLNDYSFIDGKMIFLSGSPALDATKGIPTGRLSGIVNHAVPSWLRSNQLPTYQTNCIEDWDQKIDQIIKETINQKMTLISGIPPWVKDYFERLLHQSGKDTIGELFPNLNFVVHGGVNFEPYRTAFDKLIGRPYHNVETYPASEGFLAFQDQGDQDGLLLNTNSGIFFEFVPTNEIHEAHPTRLILEEIDLDTQYAVIINSNAGLWGYNIGDTIEFLSKDPYRIRVTGRIKHFISAFGEHVISKEVEEAIREASTTLKIEVSAFTVAPKIATSTADTSCHQWIIELKENIEDTTKISEILDTSVRDQNSYYDDLRNSGMLVRPEVMVMPTGAFSSYMRKQGKQGGQNKVPVLSNDRKIVDQLLAESQ